jgi:Protein of unknown function (DUF507)
MSSLRLARLSGAGDIKTPTYFCIVCLNLVVCRWSSVVGQVSIVVPARQSEKEPTANDQRPTTELPVLHYLFHKPLSIRAMLLSKEYVGYLAREVTKKLIAGGHIETKAVPAVTEKVHASMLEELSLEDRINDEVRVILEAYSEEMRRTGANYQEMFRKVKSELVRKYKAVL